MDKKELQKIFTPKQYMVEIFKDKGFIRKECSNCGKHYWTLDQDRETCGETECVGGYSFINRKGPSWDFHKTIAELTGFFESNDHLAIESYPVVARWRADLDFTIASIADFQPWVTGGTLPPPANPLVVPQPCLRFGGEFSDVDNVGRTGRHLTSFVMFGQHAFNSENLTGGYWMDRCIELNFEFLTERLGLQPEEITYIEGIWMGGGNFGPNLESFAYGSELVNSVFMQYENTPTGYREMDLKVIDVGWGTERTSWFSQGTPTIYEATFGPVLDYLLKQTGIKPDQDLLERYAKLAGLIDINEVKDVKSARSNIASELGLTLHELNKELEEIEAIYAIGDHSRTLAFALADGAIPSNVGGGYNLRTILRRLYTLNEIHNFDLDFVEVISRSAMYVSKSFPRVKASVDLAPTINAIEYSRYRKTIESGQKHVDQLLKQKKAINADVLVDLYTSRGIPPESVAKAAEVQGVTVDIPSDFYHIVDMRKPTNETEIQQTEEIDTVRLKEFTTEQLYYAKNPKRVGEATVELILDSGHIVFDKTLFYPLGGGQAEDHGWVTFGGKKIEVTDVKKFGGAIVHKLAKLPRGLKVGLKVKMEVDWERRLALMRHHTAVHIVGGAAREVLGKHVWQAGADKTPDRGRLDITHWESIPRETLDEIEFVANSVVMDNRRINKHIMTRNEAEKKFGFTIYQGGAVPGKDLRIIEIPGIDTEACGGTHANMTGEVGYIRILSSERIQDGVVRLTLTAGKPAVQRSQHEYHLLSQSAETFSVNPEELPATADRFFQEWKDQGKTIAKLSKELAISKVPLLIADAEDIMGKSGKAYRLVLTRMDAPQADLINLGEQISLSSEVEGNIVGVILGAYDGKAMVIASGSKGANVKLSPIIREVGKMLGGGGGGKGDVLTGGGTDVAKIGSTMSKVKDIVIANL